MPLSLAAFSLLLSNPAVITWSEYKLQGVHAELGRLKVPENRRNKDSRQIELAFVRLKATGPNPGPPIIYLDGGPGSSAVSLASAPSYFAAFSKLRECGDVILLDQRGVGLSSPRLSFPSNIPLPTDFLANEAAFVGLWKARTKEALERIHQQPGADPDGYDTEQNADDINDLRQALGVEKVRIVGFSYGTHLGLSVIRRHGKHLAGAVLVGTEGPDHTAKPPLQANEQIDKIAKLVKADPELSKKIPDFKALVRQCLDKLEQEPAKVKVKFGSAEQEVVVGKYGFQHLICRDLGDTNDLPFFPLGFYALSQGDYSMLTMLAQKRWSQYALGTPLMSILVDAASGTSAKRQAMIERTSKDGLMGNAMNFFDVVARDLNLRTLPDAFRAPLRTEVNTLFVSGTLDWNTPPEQAEEVRRGFRKSTHIVVENAGHESMLTHPTIQQAMVDFFNGKDVSGVKLRLDLKFQPIP